MRRFFIYAQKSLISLPSNNSEKSRITSSPLDQKDRRPQIGNFLRGLNSWNFSPFSLIQ